MDRVRKPDISITKLMDEFMDIIKKNIAGIDVSSKTLDLVIRKKGKNHKVKKFANTPEGHKSLASWITKHSVSHVCLEATGVYHLDLAATLDQESDLDVVVLNPKIARKFSEATMVRGKTDATDADILAQHTDTMKFVVWKAPKPKILQIRNFSHQLGALTKMKVQAKNQLHAFQETIHTPSPVVEDAKLMIEHLKTQIEAIEGCVLNVIQSDEEINNVLELLTSIKGIAEKTAIQLIGELLVLPSDMAPKQWAAYAGLDPRVVESDKPSYNIKFPLLKKYLLDSYRLRAKVFCQELKWVGKSNTRVEIDEFDRVSEHLGIINPVGNIVGTIRFTSNDNAWMMEKYFPELLPENFDRMKGKHSVEVSRMAVSQSARVIHNTDGRGIAELLYKGIFNYCESRSISYIYIVVSTTVLRHLKMHRMPAQTIGPKVIMPDGVEAVAAVIDWTKLFQSANARDKVFLDWLRISTKYHSE